MLEMKVISTSTRRPGPTETGWSPVNKGNFISFFIICYILNTFTPGLTYFETQNRNKLNIDSAGWRS